MIKLLQQLFERWNLPKSHQEFFGFVIIGLLSFALDFIILNTLIYGLKFNPYVFGIISITNVISTTIVLLNSFFLNRLLNFRSTHEKLHSQLGKYLLVTLIAWCIENVCFGLFVRAGLIEPLSKIAVYAIFTPVTFIVYKLFVFKEKDRTRSDIFAEMLVDLKLLLATCFTLAKKVISSSFVKILVIFVLSRLIIYEIGVIGYGRFSSPRIPSGSSESADPVAAWTKWDVVWYQDIAQNGYEKLDYEQGDESQQNWGFMPLFPLSQRLILQTLETDKFFLVGTLFSNVFSFSAIYILYTMYKDKLKKPFDLLLFFCLSAGSFYLSIPYAEGLFLFLTVMTIFFTRKKLWLPAAIAAGFGFTARIQGVTLFLIPAVHILFEKNQPIVRKLLLLAASGAVFAIPIAVHMYFMYSLTGNPIAFISIQSAWYNAVPYPLKAALSPILRPMSTINFLHILLWALYGFIFVRNFKKFELWEKVFVIAMFLVSTSTEVFYSTYRYVLPLIPIYIALTDEEDWVKKLFIGTNCAIAVIYIFAFVTSNPLAV